MKILYIHGWGSQFDENSDKVTQLKTIGDVCGVTLDYTLPCHVIYEQLIRYILKSQPDIVIGTSLGGFWANFVGDKCGIPFVAINPAVDPKTTLKKYVGNGVNYTGKTYFLADSIVDDYYDFQGKGCGLILLDEGDEVIDHSLYADQLRYFDVKRFSGGNHRFAHMGEALPLIEKFFNIAEVVYGS